MTFDLAKLSAREVYPGYTARFVHSENMTFAYFEIEPEVDLPPHSHHHEQVVHMLEGEVDLTVDGVTTKLLPGMIIIIPPHARHTGVARVKSKTLDIFCPVREDFRT